MDHLPRHGEPGRNIVIGLILLAFTIWYLVIRPKTEKAPDTQLDEQMRGLMRSVELYADSTGGLPSTLNKLVHPEEGMRKLVAALPLDPWGRPYRMTVNGNAYTIASDGPDLQSGSADDVQVSGTWVPKPR